MITLDVLPYGKTKPPPEAELQEVLKSALQEASDDPSREIKSPDKATLRATLEEVIQRGPTATLEFVQSESLKLAGDLLKGCKIPENFDSVPDFYSAQRIYCIGNILLELKKIRAYFEKIGLDVCSVQISALARYFLEGLSGEYQSDRSLLQYLLQKDGGDPVIDFGAGPGQFVAEVRKLSSAPDGFRINADGIEMSPSFALRNPAQLRLGMIDAKWTDLQEQTGTTDEICRMAVSSLTLDRVRDPLQLIRNMIRSLVMTKRKGLLALGTLLPIIPEDDGPSVRKKIVYTPPEKRIVEGYDLERDKRDLEGRLSAEGLTNITAEKIPYSVRSSDGVQQYDNYFVFTGRRTS